MSVSNQRRVHGGGQRRMTERTQIETDSGGVRNIYEVFSEVRDGIQMKVKSRRAEEEASSL